MTQFLAIMPVLKVADLERSVNWYVGALGFAASGRDSDESGAEHCFVGAGDAALLLSTGSHLGGAPSFTGTLYFRVVGVESLFARVREQVDVVWPLERQDYGTLEFGIRDPDGYVLAFAEADESPASDANLSSKPRSP
jgi:catechol 2,3-dioxygenase-like lactoylglutathione lyase family enzyme